MWWDWEGSQAAQSGHQQNWERDFASSAAKGIPCSAVKLAVPSPSLWWNVQPLRRDPVPLPRLVCARK